MTDYATLTVTASNPPADGVIATQWYLDASGGQSFVAEMHGSLAIPITPVASGSGSGRPVAGLVWPH